MANPVNQYHSDTYYKALIHRMDQGYFHAEVIFNADDLPVDIYYIEANEAAIRWTGTETTGKIIKDLDPNYEKHWLEILGRVSKTGVSERHEMSSNPLGAYHAFHAYKVGSPDERTIAVIFEDITKRQNLDTTTDALKRSEEQFRHLIAATSSMVYRMSADWKDMYTLVGKELLVDTDQVTRNWVDKYIPVEDRSLVWRIIAKAIDSKTIFEMEHRVIQADGSVGWVYTRAVPVIDSEGEITEWLGAGNDITARREAEEAMRKSEEQLATELADSRRLQHISTLIIEEDDTEILYGEIVDTAMSIMHASSGSLQMYVEEKQALLLIASKGFVSESVEFWKWVNLNSNSTCAEALKNNHRFIVGDLDSYDFEVGAEDLHAYRMSNIRSVQSTPLVSRKGKVVGMISTHWPVAHKPTEREFRQLDVLARLAGDLLERKLAEEFLRRSEERLQLAIKGANIFTWEVNPETGEVNYSSNSSEVLGFEVSKNPSKNFLAIHPGDEEFTVQATNAALKGDIPLDVEHRIINPLTKDEIWVRAQARMVKKAAGDYSFIGITQNITERKRAEEVLKDYNARLETEVRERTTELAETKELLQGTLDSSRDMIQVFKAVRDHNGKIIDFIWLLNNETAERIYGNVKGESLVQRNPGVLQTGIFDHFVQVTETGIPRQYEKHYTHEQFDGWFYQSVVKYDDGVSTTTSDISVRKKTEIALKDSLNLLQTIYDTTLIGMSVFAPLRDELGKIIDFRITSVNKKIERSTGRNDIVGKLFSDLYPGIKEVGLFDLMVKTMETGEVGKIKYHYTYDGFDRWYSTMFVRGEDVLVSTNLDITDRVQAEDERFRNYVLLQQSEELAQSGSWDFDLVTGTFAWSDGMYRLFDLQKSIELNPEIYLRYSTADSLNATKRVIAHIRNGDQDFEETIAINVGGKIKILHIKAAVVKNDEGKLTRVLGVDLDITAMREAEDKLREMEVRQQQEIFQVTFNTQEEERRRISESLHNGVGQLLYGTRLSMNYLTVKTATEKPEKFNEHRAYTASLLTSAIKDIRRISHELMPTVLAEFGLTAAINDVCEQLQDGVHFYCRTSLAGVKLDNYLELAVFRTVQELMMNVINHAEATKAEVQVTASSEEVQISVSDNGRGMAASGKDKPGIGLSLIRNKVDQLRGCIDIQSPPGKGTTIKITLPHQTPQE